MDIYTVYRMVLSGVTMYGLIKTVPKVIKYKSWYDKTPPFMRKYLLKTGAEIMTKKIDEHQEDVKINLALVVILIILNIVLWLI
ncbi:MAG TPA: hypothetical protein V6C58_06095 [Allocoleopsis sp.]